MGISVLYKFHTKSRPRTNKTRWVLFSLLVVLPAARADPESAGWPPFLEPKDTFSPDVIVGVERVWTNVTLSRRVRGPTARVPFGVYIAFIDSPDVTTAAARFRKLADYEAYALDDDWYWANDHDGARGVYRVIVRDPDRRVILSWGEHTGTIGRLTGSALTVIQLERHEDGTVDQTLVAYVLIDNRVAATLAQLLAPVFGHLADRKLTRGLGVTTQVAEWAVNHPDAFCPWLARQPVAPSRRERILAVLPGCRGVTRVSTKR